MRLSRSEAQSRATDARVARLASTGTDLQPHLVPVTFALIGERLVTAVDQKPKSTQQLRRLDTIAQNPSVCVLWDHYSDDWEELWWVRADGHAEIVADPDTHREAIVALTSRYPQYEQQPLLGPVIMVTIRRWTGWSFSSPGNS